MLVEFTDFPTGHRDNESPVIGRALPVFQLEPIQGGHGGIAVNMEGLLGSRRTIAKVGKWFGVPEQKLNLKASFVSWLSLIFLSV
jgi:hypothetical protein